MPFAIEKRDQLSCRILCVLDLAGCILMVTYNKSLFPHVAFLPLEVFRPGSELAVAFHRKKPRTCCSLTLGSNSERLRAASLGFIYLLKCLDTCIYVFSSYEWIKTHLDHLDVFCKLIALALSFSSLPVQTLSHSCFSLLKERVGFGFKSQFCHLRCVTLGKLVCLS